MPSKIPFCSIPHRKSVSIRIKLTRRIFQIYLSHRPNIVFINDEHIIENAGISISESVNLPDEVVARRIRTEDSIRQDTDVFAGGEKQ